MTTATADRVFGTLHGTAIGDLLGGPNEAKNWTPVPVAEFDPSRGRITDDTQLTLVVAHALIAGAGTIDGADLAARMVRWLPHAVGIGRATRWAVERLASGVAWDEAGEPSAGNGAAMRASPIGLVHDDPKALLTNARIATLPTHKDPTAVLSAAVVASAVSWLARREGPFAPEELIAHVRGVVQDLPDPVLGARGPVEGVEVTLMGELDRVLEDLGQVPANWFGTHYSGAFVVESLPAAMWCFLRSPNEPEEAIRVAAEHARDADTVGAMTGAFVGAHLGAVSLPARWVAWIPDSARTQLDAAADGLLNIA